MPLPRKLTHCYAFERVELNVYDITIKEIIFTGTSTEIANKFGWSAPRVRYARQSKKAIDKKYAIRIKSIKK